MRTSPAVRRTLTVATALAAALAVAACGDDAPGPAARPSTSTSGSIDTGMVEQLCAVLAAARAGDLAQVQDSFDHGPIHTLARATADVDRSAAARLLEAKEAVEVDLEAPAQDVAALTADLQTLIDATGNALAATGASTRPTCKDTP